MKKIMNWMLAAILICGATVVLTSCVAENDNPAPKSLEEELKAQYHENKKITNGNYDKSLAVKCINGTFVGKKTENIVAYKGIPYVGMQPV